MNLSPFPHCLSTFSFSLHFLFIFSISLHFLAARLPGCHKLCNPTNHENFESVEVLLRQKFFAFDFFSSPTVEVQWLEFVEIFVFFVFYFVFEGWRFIRFIKARIYGWRWVVRDVMPKPLNPIAAQLQSLSQPFCFFFFILFFSLC